MRHYLTAALASASLFALSPAAHAQAAASAQRAAAPAEEATLGEIVVTARRRSESLQEVPQTVNAVTSDTLQKLNITQFQDVQSVVPGLALSAGSNGATAAAQLRGVTFDVNTAAPVATVAMYLNDAPVQSLFLFDSLFDVGQIEVLRGPQGTTRGVSAPSGAITVTTRNPDLSDFGGYGSVTATDQHGRNVQGAINIPLIKDVLAVRLAGVWDETDVDGVRSIHNDLRPSQKTGAERISVSFEPNDKFNANVTYQHLDKQLTAFQQVAGAGPVGTPFAAINPVISPDDRVSVQDGALESRTHLDLVTARINSRLFGQHLSYVGSYQHESTVVDTPFDLGNQVPGAEIYARQDAGVPKATTQEFRIASDPAPGRFFDYTVGAYYSWTQTAGTILQPASLLSGAFGSPATLNPLAAGAFNEAFQVPLTINVPATNQETSIFGSVTLHLGANTELSGGVRHIWSIVNSATNVAVGGGVTAVPSAAFGGNCAALGFASTYPGFCDFPVNVNVVEPSGERTTATPNVYNISLSHHFTRDIMAYANTGTAFRPAFTSPGLSGAILASTDPTLQSIPNHPPERSRSYEVGIKTQFLDGRARFNADIFRQHFDNFTLLAPSINYIGAQGPTNLTMTQSVKALVQGFEFDSAFQVTRDWNISLQASYADGKVKGTQVPCNTFAADGITPTYNQGFISLCPGQSASRQPLWNATLASDYSHPLRDGVDGFVRGLFTYYPENKNREEPNFTVPNYGLLNVYAGLRSPDGAWEVSLFAKNAFAKNTLLDRGTADAGNVTGQLGSFPQFLTSSGYNQVTMTPEREVGMNVRYAFGSR